ncbi:MAG: hypothetical protein MZV49_15440 [Rhodopseudomonas palustris]|nr:hypothetical protein [Rhodopseudomonas palustris]
MEAVMGPDHERCLRHIYRPGLKELISFRYDHRPHRPGALLLHGHGHRAGQLGTGLVRMRDAAVAYRG